MDTPDRASDIDDVVALRLRQLRLARGLARKDLAAMAGIGEARLARYERGQSRIPAGVLYALAGALDVDITSLFGETPVRWLQVRLGYEAKLAAFLAETSRLRDPALVTALSVLSRAFLKSAQEEAGSKAFDWSEPTPLPLPTHRSDPLRSLREERTRPLQTTV